MSLFTQQQPARSSVDSVVYEHKSPTDPDDLMVEDGAGDMQQEKPLGAALTAHQDARALVRLIQCPVCSRPFQQPVTLPCGNSLCKPCLPDSHRREHITYPDMPSRRRGIQCPFDGCADVHTIAECGIDVVLSKIMEAITMVVGKQESLISEPPATVKENRDIQSDVPPHPAPTEKSPTVAAPYHLMSTYNLAAGGGLRHDADVLYDTENESLDGQYRDDAFLADLLEATHKEMDCQVCYNLMLDPVTTACGHTLCRKCLVRSLDHSTSCPVCRRTVLLPPSLHSQPSNKALSNLLNGLCPEIMAARAEATALEEMAIMGELDTPLFIVTLGFPGCPTFLRIFEPRYRLMLRRAMEGNRHFGMVMYNASGRPQGELGPVHFMEYGTLLRIENVQFLPDGQSIVETRGVARFKIKRAGLVDGYYVGSVERVEDISLVDEERLEVEQTSLPPTSETDVPGQVQRMSTRELLAYGLQFIDRMQARSAPWLHESVLEAYGGPPADAAIFPYWFASILPTRDEVKYQLLHTLSVRERLKIAAMWIKEIESQRW